MAKWMEEIVNDALNAQKAATNRGENGYPCRLGCGRFDTVPIDGSGDRPGDTWYCNKCNGTFRRL